MKLTMAYTFWGKPAVWGSPLQSSPLSLTEAQWRKILADVKSEGYDAVEIVLPIWRKATPALLMALCAEQQLKVICQIHTSSTYDDATEKYVYNTSHSLVDHIASFAALVAECAAMGASMVNSHSGSDTWSVEEGAEFFKAALEVGTGVLDHTDSRVAQRPPTSFSTLVLASPPYMSSFSSGRAQGSHPGHPRNAPQAPALLAVGGGGSAITAGAGKIADQR